MPLAVEIANVAGVLLVAGAIVLAISLGRLFRRATPAESSAGGQEAIRRLRETADRLASELEAIGREARAQLETRIRVLNELILEAERLAERLGSPGPQAPGPQGARTRLDEVVELAAAGLDPAAIAARTGFERGEVELILSLARRSGTGGGRAGP